MKNSSFVIKVPGKLMIAGEYAVLSTGYPAIVIAVNRYITILIESSDKYKLSDSYDTSSEVTWEMGACGAVIGLEGEEYAFIKEAVTMVCQYLREVEISLTPFHLQIQNGLNDDLSGQKYGLGSSAAIVVGVISAILRFHNVGAAYDLLHIYKLACLAHLKTQGNGSGADIAASVYGGWLCYYRYDVNWLMDKLYEKKINISTLIHRPWPDLNIKRLILPANIRIMVGWTKHSAKTSPLVEQMEVFQRHNKKSYNRFLELSKSAVEGFIESCQLGDSDGILKAIEKNRSALQYLRDLSGIQLETEEINKLCQLADKYGKGKFSGAGGGDCGYALLRDEKGEKALKEEWEKAGIIPLDLQVSSYGVRYTS